VPGRSRRWLLLPAPALALWASTLRYGCLTDWVSIGPAGLSAGETAHCFATLALAGIPLSLVLLIKLRYTMRLSPTSVATMGSLAVAAMTAVALSLFHAIDATAMILIWNIGLAALFPALARPGGRRLFDWVARQG